MWDYVLVISYIEKLINWKLGLIDYELVELYFDMVFCYVYLGYIENGYKYIN